MGTDSDPQRRVSLLDARNVVIFIGLGILACAAILVLQVGRSGTELVPYERFDYSLSGRVASSDPITERHLDALQTVLDKHGVPYTRTGPLTLLITRDLQNDTDSMLKFSWETIEVESAASPDRQIERD